MHILYKLVFASGKCYIGQTVRKMNTRISAHRQNAKHGSMLPVHCAWRKHGEPEVFVLAELQTQEELHSAEIDAISTMNTLVPNGYNLGIGGETAPSKNPVVAAKIANKANGRKYSDTSAWSESSKLMWKNEEYRKKVSDGLKAGWTDERRKGASERTKKFWDDRKAAGWVMPESTKQKLSSRTFSDESRQKMSASAKGKKKLPFTDTTKAKLSEATKKAWKDKDVTEKRIAAIKIAWNESARNSIGEKAKASWGDPEIRAKRIAAMKMSRQSKQSVKT